MTRRLMCSVITVAAVIVGASLGVRAQAPDNEEMLSITVGEMAAGATVTPATDAALALKMGVDVKLVSRGMLESVEGIEVQCRLYSRLFAARAGEGRGPMVGFGQALLMRAGVDHTPHLLPAHVRPAVTSTVAEFDGSLINATVEIRFAPRRAASPPIEAWTDGECFINVLRSDGAHTAPAVCEEGAFGAAYEGGPAPLENCVWPGTEPADARATFKRPGLNLAGGGAPDGSAVE